MKANALNNARHRNESFKTYRARLKWGQKQVEKVCLGSFAHVSSKIVELPPAGVNAEVDEAIRRGLYRDVQTVTQSVGKEVRIGRTKGETYRRYPKGKTRKQHRAEFKVAACS